MNEKELALLCEVFMQDFETEGSELAEMYQAISEDENDWLDFLNRVTALAREAA